MKLPIRDAVGTLLVAAAVATTLSVVYAWNWPLLADARAGAIALLVLSYPSCLVAQAPGRMRAAIHHETHWGPFLVTGTVLGAMATVLIVLAIVMNSTTVLVAAGATVVAIWVVTTVDHLVSSAPRRMAPLAH